MSFYITVMISSLLAFMTGLLTSNFIGEIWEWATRRHADAIRNNLAILRIDMTYFDVFFFLYGILFLLAFTGVGITLKLWTLTIGVCFLLWDVPKSIITQLLIRRRRLLEEQLTQTINVVCNSLRAGLSLENSFQEALLVSSYPFKYELEKIVYEIAHGLPFQEVFIRSKNRMKSINSYILFVTAIITSKKRGGNLTQVLERLKNSIQVTHELERSLESATASGRFQIKIMLYFLPFFGLLIPVMFYIGDDNIIQSTLNNLRDYWLQIFQLIAFIIIYIGYRIGQHIVTPKF